MTEESKSPPPQTEEEKQSSPIKQSDAPIEEAAVAAAAPSDSQSDPSDNKRKLDDIKAEEPVKNGETEVKIDEKDDAKRQRVDESGGGDGVEKDKKEDAPSEGNNQNKSGENVESGHVENNQNSAEVSEQSLNTSGETMRKIQVPNNKVGALIGKAGETIRLLQNNSGVRIQIARDSETDPNSSTRPAELTGTPENINKAEQLIRAVIAEADAGGSPALVARNFGSAQSGSDVYEMQVPNEKAGVIIGKGGDTIKALQYKSQARIQLIPQHLPDGDSSKERTVRITGNKMQIEAAKQLIKDVISQSPPGRHSNFGGGNNQGYRHSSGPAMNQWGAHGSQPFHSNTQPNAAYNYSQQRGPYNTQYPPQSYDYPPQQRPPAAPVQNPNSYDYYGQGAAGNQLMGQPPSNPPVNYNNYGGPPAQNYGQPAYTNNQVPAQQGYSQQQGFYPQQANTMTAAQPNTSMAAPVYNAAAPTQPYGAPNPYGQGYNQPPQTAAAAYGQPNANFAPTAYGQYPQQQQPPQYADQPVAGSNVNYGGYQGYGGSAAAPPSAGYGGVPQAGGGYVSAPPASNPAAPYDQSMAGYGKGVSPQPAAYGAAPQYEAAPNMYGHQA